MIGKQRKVASSSNCYRRAYEMFNLCLRAVPLSEAISILIDVKVRHGAALRQAAQDAEAKELDDQIGACSFPF